MKNKPFFKKSEEDYLITEAQINTLKKWLETCKKFYMDKNKPKYKRSLFFYEIKKIQAKLETLNEYYEPKDDKK